MQKVLPKIKEKKQGKEKIEKDLSEEDAYVQQLQKEAGLPQYNLFDDYSEMALQVSFLSWQKCPLHVSVWLNAGS